MSYTLSPARDKIDAYGIDRVCEDIASGKTMALLAHELQVSVGAFAEWAANGEHSARVREARAIAASVWDEMALSMVMNATDTFESGRARDAAHHLRWRAAKIAPKDYGDKSTVEAKVTHDWAAMCIQAVKPDEN